MQRKNRHPKIQRSYDVVVGDRHFDVPAPLLEGISTLCKVNAGRLLIKAGGAGRECFILVSGVVSIHAPETGAYIKTLSSGELMGELSLWSHSLRAADAVANTDALVLVLTSQELTALCTQRHDIADAVSARVAQLGS